MSFELEIGLVKSLLRGGDLYAPVKSDNYLTKGDLGCSLL
jgi:hypothetical protein